MDWASACAWHPRAKSTCVRAAHVSAWHPHGHGTHAGAHASCVRMVRLAPMCALLVATRMRMPPVSAWHMRAHSTCNGLAPGHGTCVGIASAGTWPMHGLGTRMRLGLLRAGHACMVHAAGHDFCSCMCSRGLRRHTRGHVDHQSPLIIVHDREQRQQSRCGEGAPVKSPTPPCPWGHGATMAPAPRGLGFWAAQSGVERVEVKSRSTVEA